MERIARPKKTRSVSFKLEEPLYSALDQRSRLYDMTVSGFIRYVLRERLTKPENPRAAQVG